MNEPVMDFNFETIVCCLSQGAGQPAVPLY